MKLNIKINKIKSIKELEINLPTDKGLYAITGQNGSGKSTVVTCASTVFFHISMNDYFGDTAEDSSIKFKLGNAERSWTNINNKWIKESHGDMAIKGFYEGSIIFGNRFRNTSLSLLKGLDKIADNILEQAPEFIRENLGIILHNNRNFYESLLKVNSSKLSSEYNFTGDIYFYLKNGKRVSQLHMSTGENLLISVLHSINKRNKERASLSKPCMLFLDEIELALHPSSLKRLVTFLKEMSQQYNYAIYFSTHSIELISGICPENIFFLERHSDDTLEILNPCYPAYATRILYDHTGYDYVILVEDDLASGIIKRILKKYALLNNKLVHVLPCGGYSNVIELGQEVITSNLLSKPSNVLIVLDGDVKEEAQNYILNNQIKNNIPLNFLPLESLEKFLKTNLYVNVDHKLFRLLNDYIFHQKSLGEIINEYKNSGESAKDSNGKKLYDRIDMELRARNKNRNEIIEMIVDYLIENKPDQINKIVAFLKKQLG